MTVYKECQCSEGWRPVARLSSARPPLDIRFPDDGDAYGRSLSFSSDGNVLAVGVPFDSGNEACDGTTMNAAALAAGAVYIFAADRSGVWQRRAFLKARTALRLDQLGGEVALSGDGKVLAAKACGSPPTRRACVEITALTRRLVSNQATARVLPTGAALHMFLKSRRPVLGHTPQQRFQRPANWFHLASFRLL